MTTLSSTWPPRVVQNDGQALAELRSDLLALVPDGVALDATQGFQSRPSILRRLAALLAEAVPVSTDRIVADSGDIALAVAVSLFTGIPWAVTDSAKNAVVIGEVYPSEHTVLVAYRHGTATRYALELLTRLKARNHAVISVLPNESSTRSHAARASQSPVTAIITIGTEQ